MSDPLDKYAVDADPLDKYSIAIPSDAQIQPEPSMMDRLIQYGKTIADVGVGAVKGLGHTITTGGDLIRSIPVVGPALSVADINTGGSRENLNPTNIPQKIGFGGEQIGEFFLPGKTIAKGSELVAGALKGSKLTPAMQKLIQLGAQSGMEAAGAGTVAAGQGQPVGTTAAVAGSVPLVARGLKAALGSTQVPERLYQSALKPSTVLKPAVREKMLQTGLNEGIVLNKQALNTVEGVIGGINKEIDKGIVDATKAGKTIDTSDVVKFTDELKDFYRATVNPTAPLKAIAGVEKEFKRAHGKILTIEQAQEIKKNTYSVLRKAYGELTAAQTEGQKALAWGLKEEIAKAYPEISKLNARESALINLEGALGRFVGRVDNKDMIGIGSTIATNATSAITGNKFWSLIGGLAKSALDDPGIKTRIAIALNKARTVAPMGSSKVTPALIGTYRSLFGEPSP